VPVGELREIAELALYSPTAGNSAGVRISLVAQRDLPAFFDCATDATWRESAPRAAGLLRAGAAALVTSRPTDYTARYGDADKERSGLSDRDAWPLPYWHTDAAMATMALLLLLEERGWAATMWGAFRHVDEIAQWAGYGDEELFAIVLVGRPDGDDRRSASLERETPRRADRVREVP
jgi:nitroreductase